MNVHKSINEYMIVNYSPEKESGELCIFGEITNMKWWDEDITPKAIKDSLGKMENIKNLEIKINSWGGSTSAGKAIISILDDFRTKNNCTIVSEFIGNSASMATGIAMVADKVKMAANSLIMIHKPLTEARGNSKDFEKAIDRLNKEEDCLVKSYMRHWNGSEEELRKALENETVYTAEEALEVGLCDEIIEEIEVAACTDGSIFVNGQKFNNDVANLMNSKYANTKKKEEKKMDYDKMLEDYGITEDKFKSLNLESEVILNLAKDIVENYVSHVKQPETKAMETSFVSKESICKALECEDITEEDLINYAKIGKNPPKPDETLCNKASAYDRIVEVARANALKNACRAEGEFFNENTTKKMLSILDYEEIIEMDNSWQRKAEKELRAGLQMSDNDFTFKRTGNGNYINPKDIIRD